MAGKHAQIQKYDSLAATYSSRYADPGAVAARQVQLVQRWGAPVKRGGSVLEIGCADGFVTLGLARAGLAVTSVDLSPGMVETAARKLATAGYAADLRVGDVEDVALDRDYDCVLGMMWTFFHYVGDPLPTLRRLALRTREKLLVDINPRQTNLSAAIRTVREAGFERVAWRPFLVPQRFRVGRFGLAVLRSLETAPLVRSVPLFSKFVVVLKGERA